MPSTPANPVWRFLIDENLPRLLTTRLIGLGYDVQDSRDVGLRSRPDSEVFAYAQAHNRAIVTLDKGLSSIVQYPLPHAGIIKARLPHRLTLTTKVDTIIGGLAYLAGQDLADTVITIEPGRVRIRR